MASDSAQPGRHRRLVSAILHIGFLAGAIVFLSHRVGGLHRVAHLLSQVSWKWFLLAVALQALALVGLAAAQHRLLAGVDVPSRLPRVTVITAAANAVAQSVPAGAVFAEGYAFRRYRELGANAGQASWVELSAGATAMASLLATAFTGAVLVGRVPAVVVAVVGVALVGAFAAAAFFQRPRALEHRVDPLLRWMTRARPGIVRRAGERARRALHEVGELEPGGREWALAAVYATANWLLDALCLATAYRAVDVELPWRFAIVAFALSQVLVMLPITVGGLGVVESGVVVVLGALGVPSSSAGAGIIAYRAVSFWLLVLVGWICVLALRAHAAVDEGDDDLPPEPARHLAQPTRTRT